MLTPARIERHGTNGFYFLQYEDGSHRRRELNTDNLQKAISKAEKIPGIFITQIPKP